MSIQERAMLIQVSLENYTGRKAARTLAEDVAEEKGAEKDSLTMTLKLIPRDELKDVEAATRAITEYYDKNTLVWIRRGPSLLPVEIYDDFMARLGELVRNREAAVERFKNRYEYMSGHWLARLNGLAGADYIMPTADDVAGRYTAKIDITPIPDGRDFRINLGEDEVQRLAAAADAAAAERVKLAVADAVSRLRAVVERFAKNLEVKTVQGDGPLAGKTRKGRVSSAMERDLRDILGVLPAFNLTGDPRIDQIAKECQGLLDTPADVLKVDDIQRHITREKAVKIADKMRSVFGE